MDQTSLGYKRLSLFMFPTLFLYFKRVIKDAPRWNINDLIHYIVPILFFTTVQSLEAFGYLLPEVISLFYIFYFLLILFYLLLSIRLYQISFLSKHSSGNQILNMDHYAKKWILFLLIINVILCFRVLVIVCMDLYHGTLSGFENGMWLWATIIIAIFVKLLISPEILFGSSVLQKRVDISRGHGKKTIALNVWKLDQTTKFNNKQDELLSAKVQGSLIEKIQTIEEVVFDKKLFGNSNFDLQMLAREIKVPKSHLTFIFKYHCQLFFPEFKKMLQIREAENLIDQGYLKDNTIESLSVTVGFSSYNPFYVSFKKHTGFSPQNYIKQ
ncbi:helix-turn-helix transcriptional regulator [Arenibacter sp. BSSL-BM3]|uniref:Helix-turn-helix transcriptional regulator n=1 Tax=Arenibacter arenosicollis TaxID=2762274 RepID=A0ABR7QQB3_9FLAO|nr:AraC family transcriptional regulator [Arenibacter arenosicollis]MBC8769383.1 helix-turn-helix transcriptional regulator [Arenibacter arenosicollis]